MNDVMYRQRTTMSDSDVVHKVVPRQSLCVWTQDSNIVAEVRRGTHATTHVGRSQWRGTYRTEALQHLKRQLHQIPDNWDGYYAKAPDAHAINTAVTLLEVLVETLPDLPLPDTSPSTDGGVILEWESPNAEVLLVIDPMHRTDPISNIDMSIECKGSRFEGPLESLESELLSAFSQIASHP